MATYPSDLDPLYRLLAENYDDPDDFKRLVQQSGGSWGQIPQTDKPANLAHEVLVYLSKQPAWISRLGMWIRHDGYMTDDVARGIDDHLAGTVPWRWKPALADLARDLTVLYPEISAARQAVREAEFDADQIQMAHWSENDIASTWRSVLLVAAILKKVEALLEQAKTDFAKRTDHVGQKIIKRWQLVDAGGASQNPKARGVDAGGASQNPKAGGVGDWRVASNPKTPSAADTLERPDIAARIDSMRNAVKTLDRVRKLFDAALDTFGRKDAGDEEPLASEGQSLEEVLEAVSHLGRRIAIGKTAAPSRALRQLVATVLAGLKMAEDDRRYGDVAELAEAAAEACSEIAAQFEDEDPGLADLLRRVAPYWQMKAAYAQHLAKTAELEDQKRRASASGAQASKRQLTSPAFDQSGS